MGRPGEKKDQVESTMGNGVKQNELCPLEVLTIYWHKGWITSRSGFSLPRLVDKLPRQSGRMPWYC